MTLIPHPNLFLDGAVRHFFISPAGGKGQPITAVGAVDIPHQQGLPFAVERNGTMGLGSLPHDLLCLGEHVVIDDLKFFNVLRLAVTVFDDAGVQHVFNHAVQACIGTALSVSAFDPQHSGEDSYFEFFAAQQVLKKHDLSDEKIEQNLTGNDLDGGCDGIFFFADGEIRKFFRSRRK